MRTVAERRDAKPIDAGGQPADLEQAVAVGEERADLLARLLQDDSRARERLRADRVGHDPLHRSPLG